MSFGVDEFGEHGTSTDEHTLIRGPLVKQGHVNEGCTGRLEWLQD